MSITLQLKKKVDDVPSKECPPEEAARIHAFARAAQSFLAFVDAPGEDKISNTQQLYNHVVTLLYLVEQLPEGDVTTTFEPEKAWPDTSIFSDRFCTEFEKRIRVGMTFDSPDIITALPGWFHDDLHDIYGDMSSGLMYYSHGFLQDAAWDWKFNYDAHW